MSNNELALSGGASNAGGQQRLAAALTPGQPDVITLGKVMAQSGYFKDAADAAKAIVKILYGQEWGIGPAMAMSNIFVVEGKPAPSAALIASTIKRSGRYDYRIKRMDATGCLLAFFERRGSAWEPLGESSFTMADAQAAGLAKKPVWTAYPRNMCFARAISNGARWYCPDVFGGAVYTPEELRDEAPPPEAAPAPPPVLAAPSTDTPEPLIGGYSADEVERERLEEEAPEDAPAPPPPAPIDRSQPVDWPEVRDLAHTMRAPNAPPPQGGKPATEPQLRLLAGLAKHLGKTVPDTLTVGQASELISAWKAEDGGR